MLNERWFSRPRTVSTTLAAGLVDCRINHYPSPDRPDAIYSSYSCISASRHGNSAATAADRRPARRSCYLHGDTASPPAYRPASVPQTPDSAGRYCAEHVYQYRRAPPDSCRAYWRYKPRIRPPVRSRGVRVSASRTAAMAIGSIIANISAISLADGRVKISAASAGSIFSSSRMARKASYVHRQRQRLPLLMAVDVQRCKSPAGSAPHPSAIIPRVTHQEGQLLIAPLVFQFHRR